MKRVPFKYLSRLLFAIIMLAPLSSCEDDATASPQKGEKTKLIFSLSSRGMEGATRGADSAVESRIDYDQLTVACFDGKGDKIGIFRRDDISVEGDNCVIEIDGEVEIHTLAVIANLDIESDKLEGVEKIEELHNLTVDFEPATTAPSSIPMYGEAVVESVEEVMAIEVSRTLAKIEIRDLMEDYDFVSATLGAYSSELNVSGLPSASNRDTAPFYYDDTDGSLLLYVPPMNLGEEDAAQRRIDLTVKNSEGVEENLQLWLRDYTDGETSEGEWDSLKANWQYTFNVKGITAPTPPQYEPQGIIEVRWYPTKYGKFEEYEYRTWKNTMYLLLKDNQTTVIPLIAHYEQNFTKPREMGEFCVNINLDDFGVSFADLKYQIVDIGRPGDNDPSKRWDDSVASPFSDSLNVFSLTETDGKTIVHLNTSPLQYDGFENTSNEMGLFPGDFNYRIYWRNPKINNIKSVILQEKSKSDRVLEDVHSGKAGEYSYVEYSLEPWASQYSNQKPTFLNSQAKEIKPLEWYESPDGIPPHDFFRHIYDDRVYYVFFVD